jgi:spore coat-associated protein N
MGQGRTQRGRRVRAAARSLVVLAALGVFYAAAAYAHGGHPKGGPAGSLHVAMSGRLGLDADAADLAAGDVVARTATLENRGKGAIGAITLAVEVTQSSALDRDSRSGLRIRVDRCSKAWAASTGGRSLRCAGRVTAIVGWRPLAASRSPWQLGSLAARSSEWLRVSLQLPEDASADLAGRRTTIQYRFTAQ